MGKGGGRGYIYRNTAHEVIIIMLVVFLEGRLLSQEHLKDLHGQDKKKTKEEEEKQSDLEKIPRP